LEGIKSPQYIREAWDASRGYPGGRIYGIAQTTDGYLWIGTDRGLIRFDGSVFRVFRHMGPGQRTIDAVFSLAGDSQGNLLISALGLQRVRLRNEELEELPRLPRQPMDTLSTIYQEPTGTMLARVRQGMVSYDGKSFTPLPGSFPQITAATQAHDGAIWVGSSMSGLFRYPDNPTANQPEILRHVKSNALLPFGKHGVTVGTDKGLLQWDGAGASTRLFGPTHVESMLEDRQGHVWLGTTQGLFRSTSDSLHSTVLILPAEVAALYEDREGDIWVGTSTGIVRLRQRIFTTQTLGSDAGQSGGTLFADRYAVWYAQPSLGLVRIADGQAERILATGEYAAIAGARQYLYLGQANGALLRMNPASATPKASEINTPQTGQPIIALLEDAEGTLWAGTQNAGIAEIANGHVKFHSTEAGLVLNTVSSIEEDRNGVLWFATDSGLASLSKARWQSYTARDGLPPGRINCLLASRLGVLWVGADQGLAYVEDGNVHIIPSDIALFHESIFGVAEDSDDFLWVLTSSHLFRVRCADLLRKGREPIFVWQFGTDDGLPALLPSRTGRPIVTDRVGRIWISLGNTLVIADPRQLRQPYPPTLVQFQKVSADGVSLPLGEIVSIPAGHIRTAIHFAGLNLAAPNRVRFRYKLAHLEHAWSATTPVGEASYTNLAPGRYTLDVQASNIDGLWNGPSAELQLYVEPALWQALWFRALVVLVISAMGFMVYRSKLRAMQRQWDLRFQTRLDERIRIARELHDTLLQSFHGLILRFQAVRDMLPDEPVAACDALGSVIDRAAEAITEGRYAVQALRGEEECRELGESLAAIDREFRSEVRKAEAETSYRVLVEGTPRRLHPVVRDDIYRVAREAVRNAFRHAHATRIELDIRYDEGAFRLRVRDDGDGIDLEVMDSGRRKGHYGLPGMRERATSIGGQFEIWSELRRGTEIEITIPGMIAYARIEDSGHGDLY
jgi:signal transduction histidine kinase/ligand-binding sensor domain-containing protein